MSNERMLLGRWGEQLAAQRLLAAGYSILARNVRFPAAELDIVARDGEILVFVEVRTRSGRRQGTAAESITWRKRQKLRQAALCFLQQQKQEGYRQIRFDVVCITMANGGNGMPRIEHIVNAF